MSTPSSQVPLRVDAVQNRDRILEAARRLFAERGLDVPMAAVARHAQVGPATLYRRFPTKEALVSEVFEDQFAACASVVGDALADPDPWHAFRGLIEKVCAMQAVDRGFTAAFFAAYPHAVNLEAERDEALKGFAEVTRRAQAAGRLRPDFVPDDLALLLMANRGIVAESPATAAAASRRLVAYLMSALQAQDAEPLPPPIGLNLAQVLDLPPECAPSPQ